MPGGGTIMSEQSIATAQGGQQTEETRRLPVVSPAVDIVENENEIVVHADLPGVKRGDLSVHIDDGTLTISGVSQPRRAGAIQWEEFGEVEYRRRFAVPQAIDVQGVRAELRDGVLCLRLPKSAAAKPRSIEIHSA
jgi:HSP20 family molecular chaperone IbpA